MFLKKLLFYDKMEGEFVMKKWLCVSIKNAGNVGSEIEKQQQEGWIFHSFTTAIISNLLGYTYSLLFFKE